ncbi:hypothetical protein AC578_9389 [Pseudocercospora eumusae]|uniref:Pyridoxamine 5'-phosphate oxidase putative domain-containing protein n=1 Tax=Pseudocercospora eumusae TaxID=321146 RepID=A0A139H6X6_9PEZI|nr:hypothetical protein AC578_9389 [Pseudocercospora eumusae]
MNRELSLNRIISGRSIVFGPMLGCVGYLPNNTSPKTKNHAAYLDATGSGAETIAHLYDNGRITIMFCSFGTKPRILRLFCTGRVIESQDAEFVETMRRIMGSGLEEGVKGIRAVIMLEIWKVQTACGYAVPTTSQDVSCCGEKESMYTPGSFRDRETLTKWIQNKVRKDALDEYKMKMNARSLDGLPALKHARRMNKERLLLGDAKSWINRELEHFWALSLGTLIGIFLVIAVQSITLGRMT